MNIPLILIVLSYCSVALAALIYGRRLYGSWSAATILALVSPLPFAIITPIINLILLFLFSRISGLFADFDKLLNEEWATALMMAISAIVCVFGLRFYAKTEGVEPQKPH